MGTRRSFITGLLATGLTPNPTWADAGGAAYISAGMKPDGSYVLCGLRSDGSIAFELPLPARGHAAAAHPILPEAVAFARRPGTYAIVLDCSNGSAKAQLTAPAGRHFYGHGTFALGGELLFTTENDYGKARGVVGVWSVRRGYTRVGEFWSGGTGPHDIKLMPDGETLVVANGGIETHPETGRTKLNIPTMRPNVSYLSLDGSILGQVFLANDLRKNSIRHLAVSTDGQVAFAMQWQGDLTDDQPLLGVQRSCSQHPHLFEEASVREMHGYLGSIAINSSRNQIAVTSPRSGVVQIFGKDGLHARSNLADVCGVAAIGNGFFATTGTGLARAAEFGDINHDLAWDNHLIAI